MFYFRLGKTKVDEILSVSTATEVSAIPSATSQLPELPPDVTPGSTPTTQIPPGNYTRIKLYFQIIILYNTK